MQDKIMGSPITAVGDPRKSQISRSVTGYQLKGKRVSLFKTFTCIPSWNTLRCTFHSVDSSALSYVQTYTIHAICICF